MNNEKIVIMSNDNLVLIVLDLQLLVVSDCCAGSRFGNGGVGLFGWKFEWIPRIDKKIKRKKYKENDIIGKKIKWNKNILKGWCGFFCNLRADVDT